MASTAVAAELGQGEAWVAVDPLQQPGWDGLVEAHPGSSFFHGWAWARVLRETYGHRPFYFCRLAGGRLAELLPVMEVRSRWTGVRGVSLPFTDVCEALGSEEGDSASIFQAAREYGAGRGWRFLECRGSGSRGPGVRASLAFYGHVIDLEAGPEVLLKACDGATRRGIRRGREAGLRVEEGADMESARIFYGLHCQTRRRHGLPPQPFRFFGSIVQHALSLGKGRIFIARAGEVAVAGAIFFEHGREVLYKFGASDHAFQGLRANNAVMWEAIQRYEERGFRRLHLGRTSLGNGGLRRFKLGFGASEHRIEYSRYDYRQRGYVADADRTKGWHTRMFRHAPLPLLRLAGWAIYPHLS